MTATVRTARRRFLLWAVIVPLAATLIGVAVQLAVISAVPATVAMHWGADGSPDGFAPSWVSPALTAGLGVGLTLLLGVIAWWGSRDGSWGPTLRFLGALLPATVVGVVAMVTLTYTRQQGLTDAHDSPGVGIPLLVGAGLAVVVGVAAWMTQPDVVSRPAADVVTPARVVVTPGEQVTWVRSATMHPSGLALLCGATALLAGLAVAFWFAGAPVWIMLAGLTVLFALLIASMGVFRVRVSRAGIAVTSLLGVPRWRIPLAQVVGAQVVEVNPMTDFGGWGIRLGIDGRLGVVLRRGRALQITRRTGRALVVTVDDAETAAGLVRALCDRAPSSAQ